MAITADRLRAVRTSLELEGREVRSSARLWRDFMPASPWDGKPLTGVIDVATVDGSPVPEGTTIRSVWVANGDEVWKPAELEPRAHPAGASALRVAARGGPKWGPNVRVDVVVRLEGADGVRRNVRAPDQLIRRAV